MWQPKLPNPECSNLAPVTLFAPDDPPIVRISTGRPEADHLLEAPDVLRAKASNFGDPMPGTLMPILHRQVRMRIDNGPIMEPLEIAERLGPLLQVEIASQSGSQTVGGIALIDTGARISSIDLRAASMLGMQHNGEVEASTPAGISRHYTFAGKISFPEHAELPPLVASNLLGVDMSDRKYVALLGRDFLRNKMLTYDGTTGHFTLVW